MSTKSNCDIAFTLLNDGKQYQSSDTRELRLLQLFPAGVQEPGLLKLLPPRFSAGAQEPKLFQFFPMDREHEANDETTSSDPVVGASEPELPELLAMHHSQPPTASALAQKSGNCLASDWSVQDMLNSLIAGNRTAGDLSRITNCFSTLAEHPIHAAAENVTALAVATTSLCRPHPTREVTTGLVTANQSGIAPAGKGLAPKRRVSIQEPIPRKAKHLGRRNPERKNLISRILPSSIEHLNQVVQEPLAPRSMKRRLVVGGQLVNMRIPTGVEPVLEKAKNLTKLATTTLPHPTGEINIGPIEASQSRSSSGWGLIKKRTIAIQETLSAREKNIGRRQLEIDDLAEGSLPESKEHVSQRFPFGNIPVKKRHLAIQQPLPSRQGSTGGRQIMSIKPHTREEPILKHGNPEPVTGRESVLGPVEIREPARQHTQNSRSSLRSQATPRGPRGDPRLPTGKEPLLAPVRLRTSAGQQDLSIRSSASNGARSGRLLTNRRHPARPEGRPPHRKSSAYKGVTKYRRTKRWEANIWHDGKQRYLGASATEIQAARAYDRALLHFRGEEAQLNFNLNDYRGELTQLSNVRSEDLVHILRKQSRGPGKSMPDYTYRRSSVGK